MDIKEYLKSATGGQSPIHNLVIAFLQLLLIIFWFCKSLQLSGVLQYNGTYSMHQFCQIFGVPILSVGIIIFLVAGIIFSLLPITKVKNREIQNLLIPKISVILTFAVYLVNVILGVQGQTNTGSIITGKIRLAGIGWLFCITCIAVIVLMFLDALKNVTKKLSNIT